MRRFPMVIGGLAAAMLAFSPIAAEAATPFNTGISGLELLPQIQFGNTVIPATFVGWTDSANMASPTVWVPPAGSTGGNWSLSIRYTGTPGGNPSTPNTVVVQQGGLWSLRLANGNSYSGLVGGGFVTWPWKGGTLGCGTDNATVVLSLVTVTGGFGGVQGCLDDQHLTTGVFPPRVWGTVTLSSAPNPAPPPHDD
jgi:hypothetical protein